MLIKLSTDKPVPETAAALQDAIVANQFGVLHVHNISETMAKKGVAFDRECLIVEFCNPLHAKKMLEHDMSIATMLPCRISIYQENGRTTLASLKPTMLLPMFNAPQLADVARQVEEAIVKIMTEAADL